MVYWNSLESLVKFDGLLKFNEAYCNLMKFVEGWWSLMKSDGSMHFWYILNCFSIWAVFVCYLWDCKISFEDQCLRNANEKGLRITNL